MPKLDASSVPTTEIAVLETAFHQLPDGALRTTLYRHEVRARRRSTIDDAVASLLRAAQSYSQDYRRFLQAKAARDNQSVLAAKEGWVERVAVPEEPDREEIDTAIEMLIVLTDGEDQKVATRCRQVLYELSFLKDAGAQRVEYASVRRVLVAWRSQKRSVMETLKNLSTVELRCKFRQQGLEDTMPPSPEPYERSTQQDTLTPFSA